MSKRVIADTSFEESKDTEKQSQKNKQPKPNKNTMDEILRNIKEMREAMKNGFAKQKK